MVCKFDLDQSVHSLKPVCNVQVSQAVDMAQVTPLLVELGAYDGLVALAVAKAKALDPEMVAAQHSEAGVEARQVCCCVLCCAVLYSVPHREVCPIALCCAMSPAVL